MGTLTIQRYDDATEFSALVAPFLLQNEALHCLQLGLLDAIAQGLWQHPRLGVAARDGKPVLVMMQTPPYPLILSHTDVPEETRALVSELQSLHPGEIPTKVMGPAPVIEDFRRNWTTASGWTAELAERERVYQLSGVVPVSGVPGFARRAQNNDVDLLVEWYTDFCVEAAIEAPSSVPATVERKLNSTGLDGLWIWTENTKPVSFLGAGSPTLRGVRIGPVYTPPEHRKKGYASALVADVSQQLLDAGRQFCFLFTDLNNPTSNHIYQEIGYRPVADIHKLALAWP